MASRPVPDTDHLLAAASRGDRTARGPLLERHRRRLRRMVDVRLDRRLAARVDPSDVVQEALADAARRLDKYLRDRPIPFYPWLRRLAWDRLADAYRRHLRAGQRSVVREEPPPLPGVSSMVLAKRLMDDPDNRPGAGLSRAESPGAGSGCPGSACGARSRGPGAAASGGPLYRRHGSRARHQRGSGQGAAAAGHSTAPRPAGPGGPAMTRAIATSGSATGSRLLAELLERVTSRVRAGEPADFDGLLAEYPEHAEELRRLMPAVQLLADLSHSVDAGTFPPADGATGLPGEPLGDYRLIREVGRGGMGVVYEAEQISLGRRVALKVLPFAATMDPRQLQRFHNEAKAAASLHHEHIVPVYAVGCERGVHYYAMQFIDGTTLAETIAGRAGRQRDAAPSLPRSKNTAALTHPARRTLHLSPPFRRSGPARAPRILSPGRRADRRCRRRLGVRPRYRRGPPRREASQPVARRGRQAMGRRLRLGPLRRGRWADHDRRRAGHPSLHGPRAGPGQAQPGGSPGRYLRPRGDPLRIADRPSGSSW